MRDVIIIGAGVTGASVARELSAYEADVLVLEKECEMCMGTSKANSALVHAGFDAKEGSKKAEFNVEGSRRMEALCRSLGVPYSRNGAFVLGYCEDDKKTLQELYDRGVANGVSGLQILTADEVKELEPHIADSVQHALYAETAALVCPFLLTVALCESAYENQVQFQFGEGVKHIEKIEAADEGKGYRVVTESGSYEARNVINCAGVYADELNNMVSETKYHITPVRGEYCLLDKSEGALVKHTLFQVPSEKGKGVLVTPTVHGNLLLGPTADSIEYKDDVGTTAAGLERVLTETAASVQGIDKGKIITSFAGLRAHEEGGDFVIGEAEDAPHFYNALGIESPGLSAAPAIGAYLASLLAEANGYPKKPDFKAERKGIPAFAEMSTEERLEMIQKNPDYGNVICRCEEVTEGEIREAIRRPLGARTLDGVKRRVRAGMGRCQSGFCMPKVAEILAEELNIPLTEVTKCGTGSEVLTEQNRAETEDTLLEKSTLAAASAVAEEGAVTVEKVMAADSVVAADGGR